MKTPIELTLYNSVVIKKIIIIALIFSGITIPFFAQNSQYNCSPKYNNNEKRFFSKLPPIKELVLKDITTQKGITIQYLGAGGVLLTKGETTIAIDPFFSNGALHYKNWLKPKKKHLFIQPDTSVIKEISSITNLKNVSAVFVTHAHYDHLLDIPQLYDKLFVKQPNVYGNNSVNNILKNLIPQDKLVNAQDSASQYLKPEIHWINVGSSFRVMPITSDHAPHYKFIKLYDGESIDSPSKEEYYNGTDINVWKEGRTLAYLVEIIERTDTFRIHIQTSATTPNDGLPPADYIKKVGSIDMVMFCMASFDNVSDYPDKLLKYLSPKKMIVVHWENFFKKYELNKKKHTIVPFTNGLCFLKRLEEIIYPLALTEKFILPLPNSTIRLE
jgi:hypothetical protein